MRLPLLIVDDDLELSALLGKYLRENGFEVLSHATGAGVRERLEKDRPSLVILDVMLPEKNGFDLCREIRAAKISVPILMLTAQGKVTDRVVGLELGADDYLPKPFEPRELLARIRALLRRNAPAEGGTVLRFDELHIDTQRRVVRLSEKILELTSTEFEILVLLASHPGKTLHRDDILDHVRGSDTENFNRSIDVMVSRLRSKLGDGAKQSRFIKTVWGTGYVFVGREKKAA